MKIYEKDCNCLYFWHIYGIFTCGLVDPLALVGASVHQGRKNG